jgi:plastocyanin
MGPDTFFTAAGASNATLTVVAGTTVTWNNSSLVGHNVLWDNATGRAAAQPGDAAGDMQAFAGGTSHTRLFTTAGTFTFHCSIHPGMNGTLIVN